MPEPQRLLRLNQIIGEDKLLPISKSTWWDGVASGRYPAPVKLGPRTTTWRLSDINRIIEQGVDFGEDEQ